MIRHTISKFHLWLLRKIVRANIRQGLHHDKNLTMIYYTIAREWDDEFTEDTIPSQIIFQRECMGAAHKHLAEDIYKEFYHIINFPDYCKHVSEITGIKLEEPK